MGREAEHMNIQNELFAMQDKDYADFRREGLCALYDADGGISALYR